MVLVFGKAPRLSAPHIDGWRWEHVRDLNVPAWRKWVNRYAAGNIPDVAADFLASATGWALHKQICKQVSTVTPLAFMARLLRFGCLLPEAFCRG
jgi:N-acyl-L-homoserine lactone synthetase